MEGGSGASSRYFWGHRMFSCERNLLKTRCIVETCERSLLSLTYFVLYSAISVIILISTNICLPASPSSKKAWIHNYILYFKKHSIMKNKKIGRVGGARKNWKLILKRIAFFLETCQQKCVFNCNFLMSLPNFHSQPFVPTSPLLHVLPKLMDQFS